MINIYLIYLCFSLLVLPSAIGGDHEERTTYFKTFVVPQYSNVGSILIVTHTVELNAESVLWNLYASSTNNQQCQTNSITTYLQYGSIPVAQYENNVTFGDQFLLSRSHLHGPIQIPASQTSRVIKLDGPPAGSWFLGAFVDDNESQVIKKITNVDCRYTLLINVTQKLQKSVRDITADVAVPVYLTSTPTYLRFYVTSKTYKIELVVDCGDTSLHCPVVIKTKGTGLPAENLEHSENGSTYKDCTNHISRYCRLTAVDPDIEQWAYFTLRRSNNETDGLPVKVTVVPTDYAPVLNSVENDTSSESCGNGTIFPYDTLNIYNISSDNTSEIFNNSSFTLSQLNITMKNNLNATENSTENARTSILNNPSYGGGGAVGGGDAKENSLGIVRLSRINDENMPFHTIFSISRDASVTMFLIPDDRVVVIRFDIDPFRDIGSTLKIRTGFPTIVIEGPELNITEQNITLNICIQKSKLPVSETGLDLLCSNQSDTVSKFIVLDEINSEDLTLVPFPEPGPWFIAAQRVCYRDNIRVKCEKMAAVMLQTFTYPCAAGCANGGKCTTYSASVYGYAACNCIAGYKGFICDDDSKASSKSVQLVQTLLLTLSNLFFIPAIGVAIYRRRPAEALVYLSNMFFSSFYHACDMSTWSSHIMCIMPYHVLSFCDFLCSLLSFWVTLMAVALTNQWITHTAHLLAAILLAMAVKWNTHGLVTNIVPIVLGCTVILVSWAVQSWYRKEFYPGRRAVLWLLPGIILAAIGLSLFAFVETDSNYPYIHSLWHVLMSLSILFLLPRKKQRLRCFPVPKIAVIDQEDAKLVTGSNASSSSATANTAAAATELTNEEEIGLVASRNNLADVEANVVA